VAGKAVVFAGKESTGGNYDATVWSVNPLTNATERLSFFPRSISDEQYPRLARNVQNLGGVVYFAADDGAYGWELWETDGSAAGTVIHDIWQNLPGDTSPPESTSSRPDDLTAFNGSLYFSAFERQYGLELWRLTPNGGVGQKPTVAIESSKAFLGPNETAVITFTLSDAAVDFTVDDVTVSGGNLTQFTGSGTRYSATFVPTANMKTAGVLLIAADVFRNANGMGNQASQAINIAIDTVRTGITIADTTIFEGNAGTAFAEVVVRLSQASTQTVTVAYATADGTARAGSDYTAATGTLSFASNETTKTIRIPILGDTTIEPGETFTVLLSTAANSVIDDPTGIVTIRNDDLPLSSDSVFVDDVQVIEGTVGTTTATFVIQLTTPRSFRISVRYASLERTATPRDGDYRSVTGTVFIPAGETFVAVPVTVTADAKHEADERFAFRIISATGVPISRSIATCTILNDDPVPVPVVSVSDVTLSEGQSAQKMFAFIVSLSERSPVTVSIGFQTVDGTAVAGLDYVGRAGTLTFTPGVTKRSITVWILGDTTFEASERFSLQLLAPSVGTLGRGTAIGTILNDDKPAGLRSVTGTMFAAFAAEQSTSKPMAARRR
jgi:ELWxxDGT repeat protein